jgi:hypothetical protein
MTDPLTPTVALLCKLGSIAVHADESTGAKRHHFDSVALKSLLDDPEVVQWLIAMGKMALLPKKR